MTQATNLPPEALAAVLQSLADEPLERTLDLIAQHVAELESFSFCAIVIPDRHGRGRLAGQHAFPPAYARRLGELLLDSRAGADASPTAAAMRTATTIVVSDVATDPRAAAWRDLAAEFGYRSVVSVPLVAQGQVVGVLNGYSVQPRTFDAAELAAVQTLAGQAAVAVRLATVLEAQQQTIGVMERAHDIHLRLTAAVIEGAGVEAIARVLHELIGRPVTVLDAAGTVLCAAGPPADGSGGLVGAIRVGGEVLGQVVVEEGDAPAGDLDVRAVEHAATVLALEFVKGRVARDVEERLQSDFVFDLLNGRERHEQRLSERARHHGLALDGPHRLLVVELGGWSGDEDARRRADVISAVRWVVAERLRGAVASQVGDVVAAAVPCAALPADGTAALVSAVAEMRRRVGAVAPRVHVTGGVGPTATGAPALAQAYRDAQRCVEVLRRLGRQDSTLAAEDLGVAALLMDSGRPQDLAALVDRVLGPARAHDRRRGGQLIATLGAYLDHACDVRAAARALHVHANTVKYRLGRLQELCGIDLRDPHDLLEVTLARLVLRLVDAPA